MIAPAEVKNDIEFYAGEYDFRIKRRTLVISKPGKPVMRYLWEFVKYPVEIKDSSLTIHAASGYSPEYRTLTRNFYLNL